LDTPRAAGYSPPCLAELDRAGILDEAINRGMVVPKMQMQKVDGTIIAANDWDIIRDECPYPYSIMYFIPQFF